MSYDPFYNVRQGGPKEKRIRRVELMGEHKPRPQFYIKVSQAQSNGLDEDYLSDATLREVFGSIGEIGESYRPIGNSGELKEFAFVGFFNQSHVQLAVKAKGNSTVGTTPITVEEARSWVLELYPRK